MAAWDLSQVRLYDICGGESSTGAVSPAIFYESKNVMYPKHLKRPFRAVQNGEVIALYTVDLPCYEVFAMVVILKLDNIEKFLNFYFNFIVNLMLLKGSDDGG
jgi:hypothetical protein